MFEHGNGIDRRGIWEKCEVTGADDSVAEIGLDVRTGWEGFSCRGTWEKDEVTDAVNVVPTCLMTINCF
jgi:hypothetical protein